MKKENSINDASKTKMINNIFIINALFRHIRTTGHKIAWDKVEFIAFETRTQCRKMKESFYINMYAAKNGVMNPRDGTQKDSACILTV